MDKKTIILSLKKNEIATLYLICCNKTNNEIANILDEPNKTIASRITRIYKKLGISSEDDQKRSILLGKYCPIVREIVYHPDVLKNWIPTTPTFEINEEDDSGENVNNALEKIPFPPPRPNKRRPDWVAYGVIVVLVAIIIFLVIRSPLPPLSLVNQTPESTPNKTLGALNTAITPSLVPISSTTTATNTSLPTAISTRTLTPKPTQEILLDTKFADSKLEGWTVDGKYTILNGSITWLGDTPAILSAGDSSWKNYEILASFTTYSPDACGFYLGVRVKDKNNMMALKGVRAGRMGWYSVENGKWNLISGNEHLVDRPPLVLDIKVEGNKFTWIGGTSLTMDGYESGGISIYLTCVTIDYIKVIKLP